MNAFFFSFCNRANVASRTLLFKCLRVASLIVIFTYISAFLSTFLASTLVRKMMIFTFLFSPLSRTFIFFLSHTRPNCKYSSYISSQCCSSFVLLFHFSSYQAFSPVEKLNYFRVGISIAQSFLSLYTSQPTG